ncbi:hypothetical protein PRK78_002311 [Emydomyces testavorans]|uniref:Peptidase A1 domain-containing protein n=1 Tax=Emydomyces testavorans TaxID=2070801 RepID=A0AAF0DFW9_9EURO|nr:hypothetical protein PRK78_002311 [Emydomyces testavorans]
MRLTSLSSLDLSALTRSHISLKLVLNVVLLWPLARAAHNQAAPLAIPVGSDWIGYDGNWSPVSIQVGSPPQWMNVFPNTGSSEIWVIGREGCDSSMECRTKRGGLFLSNESSTWKEHGFYEMGDTLQLGRGGIGDYGCDSISLSDQLVLADQVVSMINTTDWWIGSLGLGVKKTAFTGGDKLSFLSTLVENRSLIPSHSYGYTAGAYYQLKGVPSSLTVGGVDRNRFFENNVTFALSPDDLPVVAVKSIRISTQLKPQGSNLARPPISKGLELYTIDSSTPFFWFPEYLCTAFAAELGLEYNDTLQLYTYGSNFSKYETAMNSNISFTFTLSDLPDSKKAVNVTLPFYAFDHKLSYPFPKLGANASSQGLRYFPMRKASDPKQFTLGRAFLQEVYLAVDYGRRNFSISQAKFPADGGAYKNLVKITPPADGPGKDPSGSHRSLSTGAAAGIGVGLGAAVIIFACVGIVICRRRRKGELALGPFRFRERGPKDKRRRYYWKFWRSSGSPAPSELLGDKHFAVEAPADSSVTRFELPGSTKLIELEASEVTNPFYSANGKRRGGADGPPAYGDEGGLENIRESPPSDIHATSTMGPPVYVLSDLPLDNDQVETYIVSPVDPGETFDENDSTGGPSPLSPTAGRLLDESFPQVTPRSVPQAEYSSGTETNSPTIENIQDPDEALEELQRPPRVHRRKFSWEG